MRGALILLAFFSLFLAASLLIPSPMFPGSLFCSLVGDVVLQQVRYLSALFNGLFYGFVLWMVFVALSKRLESEK